MEPFKYHDNMWPYFVQYYSNKTLYLARPFDAKQFVAKYDYELDISAELESQYPELAWDKSGFNIAIQQFDCRTIYQSIEYLTKQMEIFYRIVTKHTFITRVVKQMMIELCDYFQSIKDKNMFTVYNESPIISDDLNIVCDYHAAEGYTKCNWCKLRKTTPSCEYIEMN